MNKPDPIDKLFLIAQFNELHREHNVIIKMLNDLEGTISPELERLINLVSRQARKIDRQVPDTTKKKENKHNGNDRQ